MTSFPLHPAQCIAPVNSPEDPQPALHGSAMAVSSGYSSPGPACKRVAISRSAAGRRIVRFMTRPASRPQFPSGMTSTSVEEKEEDRKQEQREGRGKRCRFVCHRKIEMASMQCFSWETRPEPRRDMRFRLQHTRRDPCETLKASSGAGGRSRSGPTAGSGAARTAGRRRRCSCGRGSRATRT